MTDTTPDQPLAATEGMDTSLGPVLAKCEDKTASGHWLCVTHSVTFPNNISMHSHTSTGSHVVAWVCHVHGPEVP